MEVAQRMDAQRYQRINHATDQQLDLMKALFEQIQPDIIGEILKTDLTFTQIKALSLVWSHAPLKVGALSDRLGVGISAASHLVERLVQLGHVSRTGDPEDRRRAMIALTPETDEMMTRLRAFRAEQVRRWLSRLSDPEIDALDMGLGALLAAAHADNEQTTLESVAT